MVSQKVFKILTKQHSRLCSVSLKEDLQRCFVSFCTCKRRWKEKKNDRNCIHSTHARCRQPYAECFDCKTNIASSSDWARYWERFSIWTTTNELAKLVTHTIVVWKTWCVGGDLLFHPRGVWVLAMKISLFTVGGWKLRKFARIRSDICIAVVFVSFSKGSKVMCMKWDIPSFWCEEIIKWSTTNQFALQHA